MIITNTDKYGGDLYSQLFAQICEKDTTRLRVVSGYVGAETISSLSKLLDDIPETVIQIIVGMAYKEGLSLRTYSELSSLNDSLLKRREADQLSGIYVYLSDPASKSRDRGIHAKGYLLDQTKEKVLYLGSSNFSFSGLNKRGNIELNIFERAGQFANEFENFFEEIFVNGNAALISDIENFPIRGLESKKRKTGEKSQLVKTTKPADFKTLPSIDIDLARNINNQTRSNLNTCFGKGRWARNTNIIKPRTWYEVEIISEVATTRQENYPHGEFWVTTTDGFRFHAKTQGDYDKNLRSTGSLEIMGLWIKGQCLEDSGCLSDDPQELVTQETFEKYGNSILRLYKSSASEFIMHFPRNVQDL